MMRRFFTVLFILGTYLATAQAFKGKGDIKFQVGANFQQDGAGIMGSLDYGLGENISIGVASSYLLGVKEEFNIALGTTEVPKFKDRFDFKARFNANLGNVINVDDKLDVYPGLYVSTKNFGGHLGGRYFFTTGFGVFTELNVPIAKYKPGGLSNAEILHNQVSVNVGAVFNL